MCKVKDLTEKHLRWIVGKGFFFGKIAGLIWAECDLVPRHMIEDSLLTVQQVVLDLVCSAYLTNSAMP